ncbi:MAG TPA: protein-L-isoaspartate(D-aspartate) O-methyltransferase [Candidatus Polarisedimenticolaceae bacterium]|nr:protein-L-isoaspartate(D-aspartate) O-methyltransferase [Candidatus Polarisedimenticolaceae bacterium]
MVHGTARYASGVGLFLAVLTMACAAGDGVGAGSGPREGDERNDEFRSARAEMVATQIAARGVANQAVLEAMRRVPRHRFVPLELRNQAYYDSPLPIGHRQTISQPYIVALMTELIEPKPGMRVLEIGTGSGYQAAVLAECVDTVYTIEILPELGREAAELLDGLGYDNVVTRIGDGYDGWPEQAPFDAIVVTAAPASIPKPLLDQLAVGGKLVIPVGESIQDLVVVTRTEDGYVRRPASGVRFVPMTGKAQEQH